nr:YmzC family protein [Bacillus thuringiensis]
MPLYRFNLIYSISWPWCSYFLHDDYYHYYTVVIERMIMLGEHPISKELRYIRISLVVLVIVLLFFNSEKVVEISTNHDSIENIPTSNMTQIAENTFAIQEYNPSLSSEHTIKIFKYNPDTNQLTLVKEFSANDTESYTDQLNNTE